MYSSKFQTVLAKLRTYLDVAAPEIGDRLKPERHLARDLGCSRETLRRTLALLEDKGEVWRHVGQGTFRGRRPTAAPLRSDLHIHATSVEDFVRARFLIEPAIAGEAARRATPADIRKLYACVDRGRKGSDSLECQLADDSFHRTIAEVADNPILSAVLTFLSDARRRSSWQRQWGQTYRHLGIDEFRTEHSQQHERIVATIKDRDQRKAEAAMLDHLKSVVAALQVTPGSACFADFKR